MLPNTISRVWLRFATVIAVMSGIWLASIEWLFIRSWTMGEFAYFTPAFSAAGTCMMVVGFAPSVQTNRLPMRIAGFGAGLGVLAVLVFCIQIIPIAQGNNDSGEVVVLLILPAILLFAYSLLTLLKVRKFNNPR